MAIKFDYKSGFDTLMNEVLPHYIDKQIDRNENARRFDAKLEESYDARTQAQENFDKSLKVQEGQNELINQRADRLEARNEDKILFEDIVGIPTISGRQKAIDTEGLMFKTDLYKNKLKVAGNDLDTISEKNKGIANIYRGISPQLGDIADAQIDNVVLDIDNDVLKFLQIQGAVNAQKGSAIIASFKEASKSKSETALRYSTAMASKEELKASVTNFEESKKMLNSYINSEPILGTKLNSPDSVIVAAPKGSADNPFIYEEGDEFKRSLKEGSIVKALSNDGQELLLEFTSEGDFEVFTTSTPDDIEYKEEAKTNFFEFEPSAQSPTFFRR